MVRLKLILDKRRKLNSGHYSVKLKITVNQKIWYKSIGISLDAKYWNTTLSQLRQNHPNWEVLNLQLLQIVNQHQKELIECSLSKPNICITDIRTFYKPSKEPIQDFFAFANTMYQQQIKAGKMGNAETYITACNVLKKLCNSATLPFEEINYTNLVKWETQLKSNGIKTNSIANYFRAIRALYNQAIKSNLVDAKHYPFKQFTIKTEKTLSRSLTIHQIKAIKNLELANGSAIKRSRDYFMLSFYLRGNNFRDLALLTNDNLQANDNLQDNRITYRRAKTNKIYSIKVEPIALDILNRYKPPGSKYLLPIIDDKYTSTEIPRIAKAALKNTNTRYLKKVATQLNIPKLTFYYARYTWANVAKQLGYSKDKIAEALGHEYGNKVTGIYLDSYGNEVIDEMNLEVIEVVN